jgi:hypothetical protein
MAIEDEIRAVIAEEKGRGRKQPMASAQRRRFRLLLKKWAELAETHDEGAFLQALIEIGFEQGSPEFERCVALWRAGWKP